MKTTSLTIAALVLGGFLGTSLAHQDDPDVINSGDRAIVMKAGKLSDGTALTPGSIYKVQSAKSGSLLVGLEEGESAWGDRSCFEKYTGTREQKLVMMARLNRSRRELFPGMAAEYLEKSIYEIPVEIEGKIHFVQFGFAKIRYWYPDHPEFPKNEHKMSCAVRKKNTLPSALNCFYQPNLVHDRQLDIKIDESLNSPDGEVIKLPYQAQGEKTPPLDANESKDAAPGMGAIFFAQRLPQITNLWSSLASLVFCLLLSVASLLGIARLVRQGNLRTRLQSAGHSAQAV